LRPTVSSSRQSLSRDWQRREKFDIRCRPWRVGGLEILGISVVSNKNRVEMRHRQPPKDSCGNLWSGWTGRIATLAKSMRCMCLRYQRHRDSEAPPASRAGSYSALIMNESFTPGAGWSAILCPELDEAAERNGNQGVGRHLLYSSSSVVLHDRGRERVGGRGTRVFRFVITAPSVTRSLI
jgi:hypothetical protein